MTIADMTAERIFRTELFHLGNETKRRLIELLVSSLDFSGRKGEAEKERLMEKVCGAWNDDGLTANEEVELVSKARVQGKTRKIEEL